MEKHWLKIADPIPTKLDRLVHPQIPAKTTEDDRVAAFERGSHAVGDFPLDGCVATVVEMGNNDLFRLDKLQDGASEVTVGYDFGSIRYPATRCTSQDNGPDLSQSGKFFGMVFAGDD